MTPNIINSNAVLTATALGAATILAMYLYHKKQKNSVPTKWEAVGKVKELFIYPLKSGRRIQIQTAQCTEIGFKLEKAYLRDRCLVVYKESSKEFRTARTYPKLLSISVTPVDQDQFTLTAPGMENLKVKLPNVNKNYNVDEITMWENETIPVIDCGEEVAEWLSRLLLNGSDTLRLGFHDGLYRRNVEKIYEEPMKFYTKLNNKSLGVYSDLSSYMLMNKSSVDDVISRIPNSNITMNNFRPNIVVEGEKITPYSEDKWNWIKIGDVIFQNVKPCTRCALTTINPETYVKSSEHEPIKTLKTYRLLKNLTHKSEESSPVLGINMGLKLAGKINVGDQVYVG